MSESFTIEKNESDLSQISSKSTKIYILSPLSQNNELNKRLKLKKDALENVDFKREYQHDPKYKTELCKSWTESEFCAYGNKCRFAHGKHELFDKIINCKKYKQKECMSFFKNNYCCYGSRCHFKHEERRLEEIRRSYYTYLNLINDWDLLEENYDRLSTYISSNKNLIRLPVFLNFVQNELATEEQQSILPHKFQYEEFKNRIRNANSFEYQKPNLFYLNYYNTTHLF
jgi:hypothetical protein